MEATRQNVDALLEERKSEIEELQARCKDVLPPVEEYDDIFLLRYVLTHLKGKGGSASGMDKAEKAVRETVEWRQKHKDILEEVRRTGKAPHHDIASNFFTGGRCGDFNGLEPVWCARVGHCNFKGLMSTLSVEEVSDWLHYTKEFNYNLCDKRTRETRKLIKCITVVDFSNFSLFGGDRRFYQAVGDSSKRAAILYPQFLAKNVLINTPVYIRKVMAACGVFFPKSFLEKIAVCPATDTFKPESPKASVCPFIKLVTSDLKDLPTLLGGTAPTPQYLLPRAECDNALTTVQIKRASCESLEFEVPEGDVSATWEVLVQDSKLKMYAVLRPDDGSKEIEVMASTKLKAENGLTSITIHLPKKGNLIVTFDNKGSVFSGKTIEYRINVAHHADEGEISQSDAPTKREPFDMSSLIETVS
mmetsp:Transcript_38149/g.93725  ORF Transcript_38149/g.93725 Transcript_38149/m.93725 type:complete len:418 (+) Transcript_38149:397-1650(+)|eukprot:CAMPEP_0206275016 /NCGR_PEP_ID=MMETSP0047_2-20121206/35486_1 /ASSEMBLY_ACC=CAM_ASM_000192 /TAXON_ID=195065 /ORGANISM="Chroomonas mesostigmatica_cf, Strain CCMP1168" /LENGTH=417 /DNA_ID=CAMNT_0053704315 /DNA_START=397 /DNA_END=1650 /DNA_ORIENTATION=+